MEQQAEALCAESHSLKSLTAVRLEAAQLRVTWIEGTSFLPTRLQKGVVCWCGLWRSNHSNKHTTPPQSTLACKHPHTRTQLVPGVCVCVLRHGSMAAGCGSDRRQGSPVAHVSTNLSNLSDVCARV